MVSRSTFFAHRKQQRNDGDITDNSSDADDDDDGTNTEAESSRGRWSPPLAPFPAVDSPAVETRRQSPYRRRQRTASPVGSLPESRLSLSPSVTTVQGDLEGPVPGDLEGAVPGDLEGHLNSVVVEDVGDTRSNLSGTPDGSATPMRTPIAMSPPPVSPSQTPEDTPGFDEIEEAIFTTFDIEDLLYAAHIEVEPWLRLGIVLLRWKSRKNISTHAYNELRKELAVCLGIKVPSDRTIISHLQRITGLYPVKFDCCVNGCQAYVGRYRRAKKCCSCGHKRYQADQSGDEEFADVNSDDSELSDSATYADDLDENSQVSRERQTLLLVKTFADGSLAGLIFLRNGLQTNLLCIFL
jgi:hypothetical protein